jgi:hypothetical protein
MSQQRIRISKVPLVVRDDGPDQHWRGAQVRSAGPVVTIIRAHREMFRIEDHAIETALFAAIGGAHTGHPCLVRFTDAGTIAEVKAAAPADHALEAAYLRDGVTFSPGRLEAKAGEEPIETYTQW